MSVVAGERAKAGKGGKFQRQVGAVEHYVGIGLLCLTLLFCTAVLIRGLAPRGVLWGANEPLVYGEQPTALSGSSTLGSLTRKGATGPAGGAGQPAGGPLSTATDGSATGAVGGLNPDGSVAPAGGAAPGAGNAVSGNAGGGGNPSGGGAPSAGGGQPGGKSFLPVDAPGGLTAAGVEHFTKDNAFEKIDGGVQAYINQGMLTMEQQKFSQGGQDVTVEVYDMGEPLHAFGMLATERNPGAPVDVGQDGYTVAGSVFFRAGRYYARAIASDPGLGDAALALARSLAKKMPGEHFDPPGLGWLPPDNLKPGSIRWSMQQALATDFLGDVYVGTYQLGGEADMDGFLAKRGSGAEAEGLLGQWKTYLAGNGAVEEGSVAGQKVVIGSVSSGTCMGFAKGGVFGGVSNAPSRSSAEKITAELVAAAGKMQ
jgi:hypothetical protein